MGADPLVVGLDIGGTSTRAAVVSVGGDRSGGAPGGPLGTGRAGGGNPTSHGADAAAEQLRVALDAALAGLDPGRVRAGAIGLAGAGRLRADPAGRAAFDRAWRDAGLRCPYQVHGDALIGYAAGSHASDGSILIAGTGAIAAEVRGWRLTGTADGHGWLLGDAGSGYWLGREAVRRTLADLDAHREPGPLGTAVLTALLGSATVAAEPRETVDALVQAVTRRPPVELAMLAPLVLGTADPVARSIIEEAATNLVGSVGRIRPAGAPGPLVLAGGLLTAGGPLAAAVRAALAARWPGAPLATAGDGALAAAWLAARTLPGLDDPAALHRRLLGRPDGR